MSSSSLRAIFLVFVGLGLGGCWLQPLYGPNALGGEPIQRELASIGIQTGNGELEHILRNQLIDDLNPGGLVGIREDFSLEVDGRESTNSLLIQLDDTITRRDLTVAAEFTLRSKDDDRILLRSAVRRVASYNIVDDSYATLIAERDARRRAAKEVSLAIRTSIALYLRGQET